MQIEILCVSQLIENILSNSHKFLPVSPSVARGKKLKNASKSSPNQARSRARLVCNVFRPYVARWNSPTNNVYPYLALYWVDVLAIVPILGRYLFFFVKWSLSCQRGGGLYEGDIGAGVFVKRLLTACFPRFHKKCNFSTSKFISETIELKKM